MAGPETATLRRLRALGLAGTGLLATGAYLAGALPGAGPASQAEALWGTGPAFRVGLAAYLAGLLLLGAAWWRLGGLLRHELRREPGPPLRWVLVTGALWALPLLVAPPLGSRDLYAYACQGAVWLDGHDPYTVGAAGGGCPWLAAVPGLWHDTSTPYGPLALVGSAAAVMLARLLADGDAPQLLVAVAALRAVAVAGALLVAGYGPRLARACGVDPAHAAWLGLVTPLVAVHVVSGGHNDALVAGLLVAALALAARSESGPGPGPWQRRWASPALAGAGLALGLAVAVKVTAVAAAPFALLLAGRRGGPSGVGVVAASAVASFAGLTLATGLGLGWTGALADTGALVQWSSLPTGLGMAAGYGLWGLGAPGAFDPAVAVARVVGLVALALLSAALLIRAWRHRHDPSTVVVATGVVLAAVVVLGPVFYPWYAVTPLAVLAASVRSPRAGRWLAVATLVLTALVLPSGLGVPVLTKFPGALAVALAAVLLSGWGLRRWRRRRPRRRHRAPPVPAR